MDVAEFEEIRSLMDGFKASGARYLRVRSAAFDMELSLDAELPADASRDRLDGSDLPMLADVHSAGSGPVGVVPSASGDGLQHLEEPRSTPESSTDATGMRMPPEAGPATPREGLVEVRSPAVGVFFRAPSPADPPFVEVGVSVDPSATVGLVEAMKVYTAVSAGTSGTVAEIVAADEQFVEHGQLLMLVEPDDQ